jgi:4'-phosphopantetheinyl transferase
LRAPGKAQAFVVARTRLRQILGRYLDISPQNVCFTYHGNSKPALSESHASRVKFNLTHSGGLGLCALTLGAEIGVDLEVMNGTLDFEPLAERFFSSAENRWLQTSTDARHRRNFFRLWTRKEAWLKGKGGGFSSSALELDPALVAVTSARTGGWWVRNIPVRHGYVGALAVAGQVEGVDRLMW